jgi:hypothetical protein
MGELTASEVPQNGEERFTEAFGWSVRETFTELDVTASEEGISLKDESRFGS